MAHDAVSSLLERYLTHIERRYPGVQVNLDDLTGFLEDVPGLNIARNHRYHSGAFCMLMKKSPGERCWRNKMASNRMMLRGDGVTTHSGCCYLGLSDLIVPIQVQGTIMGLIYAGSVRRQSFLAESTQRFEQHQHSRRQLAQEAFDQLPVLDDDTWQQLREDLELMRDVLVKLLESHHLLGRRYQTQCSHRRMLQARNLPDLVQRALHEIEHHYDELRSTTHLAERLRCNPQHLTRLFLKHLDERLMDHLHQVRIDAARRLLANTVRGIKDIAYAVGYQEKSHFYKQFKRITGMTPFDYRESAQKERSKRE